MKITVFSVMLLVLMLACENGTISDSKEVDPFELLQSVEGLEVNEMQPQNGFPRQFEVYIEQPLDHNNPDGASFRQRIFISHKSLEYPVVFMPSGYSSSPVKVCELTETMPANQIYAAHRFMAGAEPDNRDWSCLTIEQASADFHRVVQLLNDVYPGPWISYGISKNGQAALFHRRFYADDVKATVCIGTPLSAGIEDNRYETFLSQVGTPGCRDSIKAFQRHALESRVDIQNLIKNYIRQSAYTYTRMNEVQILEFEILEYPFSFWQMTDGKSNHIPDTTASATDLFNYIKNFGYLDFYSDELLDYFEPVYYQAYSELGWYRLIDDHLHDLLLTSPSYRQMAPRNIALIYNAQVLEDIREWVRTMGNNMIYIYGENDPWTAAAVAVGGSTNAIKIIQSDANHSVLIKDLDERHAVYGQLDEWMNR